ncbi:MAG: glycosyltransferase family 4 protein [Candidatus Omnitrophota bacterium]|jgi:glycosyltransferase involved in cell wall biosynthesis
MKKVLFISFEYPTGRSYCGGVGQIVKQSRNALLDLGYEAYVLISAGFTRRQPVKLLFPDGSIKSFMSLNKFLKEYDWYKFNYVIHHFINWAKELKVVKKRKGRRPQIIYHFHSILRREKESGFRLLNSFLRGQERMIELADKIICPSAYEYENFARYFPAFLEKVVLIENTIERFSFKKKMLEQIKSEHNIVKGDVVSLYVGRLERIKGAHIVLDRVPRILEKNRNLKLFFVGRWLEPDLYRKLLRVCRKFPRQFFYKRFLNKSELFQYYYLSDIYINSSLSESFSLSTHESALCNTALLLNRLPVLERFKDAALFFDVNKDDFTRKYEILIKDSRLRSRLAKRAFAVAVKFVKNARLKENFMNLLARNR